MRTYLISCGWCGEDYPIGQEGEELRDLDTGERLDEPTGNEVSYCGPACAEMADTLKKLETGL